MAFDRDIALIGSFKSGDLSAFEKLVCKYQDKIYNLCRYILRNELDAQDAAQDVFLKAYKSLNRFNPKASFYTWLYRIAVNTCLDYKRKSRLERFKKGSAIEDRPSAEPSPERLYESIENVQTIQAAFQKLPENLRFPIILKEIESLSYEEIAQVLHIAVGTVKSRISRARDEMRRLLRGKIEDIGR
jgi:RNA polymerase sigma-70 factor (ECF subfamily)